MKISLSLDPKMMFLMIAPLNATAVSDAVAARTFYTRRVFAHKKR